MRLRKIRLAGFKSFVDPTTVLFPSDLIGIVGPNGCGKSNIIDAVRWVMGEISAKHLRGGSMADVVFNGSNTRKPVGQAAVELVFDNHEGRIGGRYASYGEIAVKRQVTRDGTSSYYLNGTRCRRRDIMDLFLGTGLGPRSYAIIEQGMISRLIEARPEELREFIEEAAGISKYKERRRETENRIRHTQENLDRLNDIREELGKRLTHLKRQATIAEKYKTLKQEQRRLVSELLALRWRALDDDATSRTRRITEQETALEAVVARQRELETALLHEREQQAQRSEHYNGIYMQVQDAAAAIARAEGSIEQLQERRRQLTANQTRESEAMVRARAHCDTERARVAALEAEYQRVEPALGAARLQADEARAELLRCEEAMQTWQAGFEELSQRAAEPARAAEAERARIRHSEERMLAIRRRLERLEQERDTLDPTRPKAALEALQAQVAEAEQRQQQAEQALLAHRTEIHARRETIADLTVELDDRRSALQEIRGRLASLNALQQDALGKTEGEVTRWLAERGIDGLARLAELLEVDSGWEHALERVLDRRLQSVCTDDMDSHAAAMSALGAGTLGLFDTGHARDAAPAPAESLAAHVRRPAGIAELLHGIGTAPDLATALARRATLAAGESLVTPAGEWVGRNWIEVTTGDVEGAGVIAREQEIRALNSQLRELEAEVAESAQRLDAEREHLRDAEDMLGEAQAAFTADQRRFAGLRAETAQRQAQYEQARGRLEAIEREVSELNAEMNANAEQVSAARAKLQALTDDMQRLSEERERWAAQRETRRGAVNEARERWQSARDVAYEAGVKVETLRTQIAALRESETRNVEQLSAMDQRLAELAEALAATEQPLAEARAQLDQRLAARRGLEQALVEAREAVEQGENSLRTLEQSRHAVEQAVQEERSALEQLRLATQEIIVRRRTVTEQLTSAGEEPAALLEGLAADADASDWETRIAELEASANRLGPINLAAIEEFEQQSERKQYLDQQNADLDEALATLTSAIQKIDRETRARFKETYEKVNTGLSQMFPKLFGGGAAYLEMTGDDLLSTGITVMARPPGKRNSTIQLLSGGEKALTAVSLVFSIFELNPAPFCLLDEVDAPLDDANVVRFSELVKEMSERVQMIVVTHNKTTMEVTQQLVGVTMQEPGVSRLVAVDVDEAARMVAV